MDRQKTTMDSQIVFKNQPKMNTEVQTTSNKLPSLKQLYGNKDIALRNTALSILLNAEPKQEWVKIHPITKQNYMPIERIEYLLTSIFGRWRVEVKSSSLVANSIQVIVRLHYIDPITGDWEWQEGIGAAPLQTNQGAGAVEFNQIKSAAVQIAAPSAETYAIKDAAEKLGKLFGKDLNRKDMINYNNLIESAVSRFTVLDSE